MDRNAWSKNSIHTTVCSCVANKFTNLRPTTDRWMCPLIKVQMLSGLSSHRSTAEIIMNEFKAPYIREKRKKIDRGEKNLTDIHCPSAQRY